MQRGRGSKLKGSTWEREVCTRLSLWVTAGQRADIFSRNVLSGGRFTMASRAGRETSMPGDMTAAHPLAFQFLSLFSVECKHHHDLHMLQYLVGVNAYGSFIGKTIHLASKQAAASGLRPFVVAKQDHQPALLFMQGDLAPLAIRHSFCGIARGSLLHNGEIWLTVLDHFLHTVPADKFLNAVTSLKGGA